MAKKVNKISTPASEDQIVSSINSAWVNVFGKKPTINQIGKTWAQIALETGRGQIIFNNNVGNINWTPNFSGSYYEIKDSRTVGGDPSNRQYYTARMRAYNSLDQGIEDYLKLLKNRGPVLDALEHGTPKDFSYALASVHYYDPNIRDDYKNKQGKTVPGYTSGITSIYNQFMQKHKKGLSVKKPQKQDTNENSLISYFLKKLEKLLDAVASEGSMDMKINKYGSKYPFNKYLISIDSDDDLSSKLEFARILSMALKEELDSDSEIYTDGSDVEMQCIVNADRNRGLEVVKEFCAAFSDIFKEATKSIGGINIYTFVNPNEDSYYQKLDIKLSEINYKKFQLKFAK